MNLNVLKFVHLAVLWCCLAGCSSHPRPPLSHQQPAVDSETLEQVGFDPTSRELFICKATAAQSRFPIGAPVVVTVSLHNGLDRVVQIRDYLWHYPFFTFDVRGPDGRAVPLTGQFPIPGGSSADEWKPLFPGQTYTVEIDLVRWYDLSKPGTYEITARWCAHAKQAPYERVAKPIRVEITPEQPKAAIEKSIGRKSAASR